MRSDRTIVYVLLVIAAACAVVLLVFNRGAQ
jgi:hypothetical protein